MEKITPAVVALEVAGLIRRELSGFMQLFHTFFGGVWVTRVFVFYLNS
jgi:hypothetical protein